MSCRDDNKRYSTLKNIRKLARRVAEMDESVYVLYEKNDGSFGFCKEGESYEGRFEEYIYP